MRNKEKKMNGLKQKPGRSMNLEREYFHDRNRRATDLKECARITLPKPLDTKHEAIIEMRRGTNNKI